MAAAHFRGERCDHTLQPTALVHEVFLRLAGHGPRSYDSREHFFGIASKTMRRILIEAARSRRAQKRGGACQRVPLDDLSIAAPEDPDRLALYVALDAALVRLEEVDPHLARIVELRYFAELTCQEAAKVMQMGESTLRRDWAKAREWFQNELGSAR
jgi:RNA polymerase sigma factor (TIGR02999 family)